MTALTKASAAAERRNNVPAPGTVGVVFRPVQRTQAARPTALLGAVPARGAAAWS